MKNEDKLKALMSEKERLEFEMYEVKTSIIQTKKDIKKGKNHNIDKIEEITLKWKKGSIRERFYRLKAKHLTQRLIKLLSDKGIKTKDLALMAGCSYNVASSIRLNMKFYPSYYDADHPKFIDFGELYHEMVKEVEGVVK